MIYGKYAGTDIRLDGEEYIVMREDEVLRRVQRRGGRVMSIGIRPLDDHVVVKRMAQQPVAMDGTLYIPDAAAEKPVVGVVVAAGRGRLSKRGHRIGLDVAPGDVVIYGKYAGTDIRLDGEEYIVMREDEVLRRVQRRGGRVMSIGIRPLDDHVVVKRMAQQPVAMDGTLYIPDAAAEKPVVGVVVAAGGAPE